MVVIEVVVVAAGLGTAIWRRVIWFLVAVDQANVGLIG